MSNEKIENALNNLNQNQNIIPFGKYKGQPLEILQNDPSYLEWLQVQPWFLEKYSKLNTLIINNFQAPSETPEHNSLQVMFLDQDFCLKISKIFYPNFEEDLKKEIESDIYNRIKSVQSERISYLERQIKEELYRFKRNRKFISSQKSIIQKIKNSRLNLKNHQDKKDSLIFNQDWANNCKKEAHKLLSQHGHHQYNYVVEFLKIKFHSNAFNHISHENQLKLT